MSSQEGSADTSTKFLQLNREVGVLTYGLAEVGYRGMTTLYDRINRTSEFSTPNARRVVYFDEIADIAERTFRESFERWIARRRRRDSAIDPTNPQFLTGFILAGYDANVTNQFKVLNWQSPNFERGERPYIIAAQWVVSQYLVSNMYYPEMTVEQLKRLGVAMLIETETVSPTVGGQTQMATVTLGTGFQRVNEPEIQAIMEENQPRFAAFRKTLLDELLSPRAR